MSALGKGFAALAVGAGVSFGFVRERVEVRWVGGGCRRRLDGKHKGVYLGVANDVALGVLGRLGTRDVA